MATLFEIGEDFIALDRLLDETGGELTDPNAVEAFDKWMSDLENDQSVKLENYCQYIRQLESEAAVAKAEAEQFLAKAKTREARAGWLKDRMKQYMEGRGLKSVDTVSGRKIAVQGNGGLMPLDMDEIDPKALPEKFQAVKIEVDRKAVRESLEAGEALPFARLKPRGNRLVIK